MLEPTIISSVLGDLVDPAALPEEIILALQLPANTFSDADLAEIVRLPVATRDEMLLWFKLLKPILPVGRVRLNNLTRQLDQLAREMEVSAPTVRRRYDRLLKHGWRGLVNRSAAGPAWYDRKVATLNPISQRPAFIDFWRGMMEMYQGRDQTGKAAYRALLRRLEAWEDGNVERAIPGYSRPPQREKTGKPAGWSYDNLMEYQPARAELMAAKYGRGALADFRLPVLSTRQGLKVGQVYVFDDQDLDLRVNYLGVANQWFRPVCFDVQDYASAAQPLHAFKPVLVDDATGKKRKLTELDFRWFVVALLTTVGYRRDTGTTLIVEHGTAAIRNTRDNNFEDRIFHATGGLVKVDRGGIAGQPAYAGMFEGQPRGNFKFKATLESARVRLRNDMAVLPGAVGKDRDHAPEGDYGMGQYNQKLLNAALTLPTHLAERLQFPVLDWREFVPVALEMHRLIDARTEHDLEGWERCGYIVHEYRLSVDSQQWLDARTGFARMNDEQRGAIRALVESTPGLWRTRKMSPQEVWDAGRGELITVPDHALPLLMGVDDARTGERCEKNKLFVIQDKGIDAEPMHFDASALIQQGVVVPGEKYSVYLNPFAPQKLIVCDASLRYLGTAHFWDRIGRLDYTAAAGKIAHARQQEAPSLENLSRRGAAQSRRMLAMRENNGAVLTGRAAPLPPAESRKPFVSRGESATSVEREAAILRAADDAALLDGNPPDRSTLPAPSKRLSPPPQPKAKKAEGSDLDLL